MILLVQHQHGCHNFHLYSVVVAQYSAPVVSVYCKGGSYDSHADAEPRESW